MNLMVNAADAIGGDGGVITVATGQVHADRAYLATTFVDEGLSEGTRFRLLLPSTEAAVAADPWASPSPKPWRGSGTVLVVDDEPMVRDVAKAILQRLGLDVVLAGTGDEAVERYAADPDTIDLVLLDLTMPGLSSAETFRQLRQIRPDAAVVLMSGYSEEEASGRFVGKGLAGFIEKPFSTQELVDAIRGVLAPKAPDAD
jgi:two-component system cell cycle sensor histidine kinase/response regulator CckA